MKIQLLLLISLLCSSFNILAQADQTCEKEFNVLKRGKKDKYIITSEKLSDLNCKNEFSGKYFRIVQGTSDKAINFDSDPKLLLKAANVYYHLTKARNFWINELDSQYVKNLATLTIRLEITNSYSQTRHFVNSEQEENYNNAWSTPEGETPNFVTEKKSWGKEIWFSPIKKLATRDEVKSEGKNPVHESLVLIKDPVLEYNKNSLLYGSLGLLVYSGRYKSSFISSAVAQVGSLAVLYGLIETSKHIDKWFIDKYYFIDTALVPDIIYHEFAHIALSDTMTPLHSIPVIEGMADYFAALIVDRKNMYGKIKGISNNKVKKKNNTKLYHPYLEEAWNAESDFTLSLLWKVRQKFVGINKIRLEQGKTEMINPDKFIYYAHFHLDEQANIMEDLTAALVQTCKEYCNNLRAGVGALNQVFEDKGFN